MSFRINICDLSLGQLNGACLTKVSHFAQKLEQYNGTIIELRDDQAIGKVVEIAKKTDCPELKELYQTIKLEIKKHINSPSFMKYHTEFSDHPKTPMHMQ